LYLYHIKMLTFANICAIKHYIDMANFSFDIVSEYDKAEMNNVFDQTEREMASRYDFKGTPAAIEWLEDKTGIKVTGSGDWQIDAILDIFRKKLAARGQSQKVLDTTKEHVEANLKTTKDVPFKQGLDQEKAKQITKIIREDYPKVKPQIQGDAVRVMSNSKDDLQAVMQLLRSKDFDFPLNFTNYR
jgi:cyclic-di-GMP-binding protein